MENMLNETSKQTFFTKYNDQYAKKTLFEFLISSPGYSNNSKLISYMGKSINKLNFEKSIMDLTICFKNIGVKNGEIVGVFGLNTPEIVSTFYALNNIGAISQWNNANGMTPKLMNNYLNRYGIKKAVFVDVAFSIAKEAINNSPVEVAIVNSVCDSFPRALKIKYLMLLKTLSSIMNSTYVKSKLGLESESSSYIRKRLLSMRNYYEKEKIAAKAAFHIDDTIPDNILSWKSFHEKYYRPEHYIPIPYEHDKTTILVNTGGTTGPMKSIELTDYNMNSAAYLTGFFPADLKVGDKFMHLIPPIVATSLMSIHYGLFHGFNTHLVPTYNKNEFVDLLIKIRPQHVNCVPAFLRTIINNPKLGIKDLSFLKHVNHGGEGITSKVDYEIDKALEIYASQTKNRGGYGLSEVTGPITWNTDTSDGRQKKHGSCGYAYQACDIKILDSNGNDMGFGKDSGNNYKIGEIFLSGPILMKGYYGDEAKLNDSVFKIIDGIRYFDSGDIGYLDEEKCLFHKGRKSRIIRTIGGGKVFVPNLEDIISNMEEVEACAVVAMPLDNEVKVPAAHIVLHSKYKNAQNLEDIKKSLIRKIEEQIENTLYNYYAIHSYIFSDSLPMTSFAKIAFTILEEENFKYYHDGKPYMKMRDA